MLQTEIVVNKESKCETREFKNFCIREYVGAIRERNPATCWPFESICEFKDLDTKDMILDSQLHESLSLINLKIAEDTNDSELPKVQNSKRKEVEFEAPTAFELEWTKENKTGSEIAPATTSVEISEGNKTQMETATVTKQLNPKCKWIRAFELESSMGIYTGYESDTGTEIITSKKLNDGMDEIMSDGGTEVVNLCESENEKSVNGSTKTEISVITDDANLGKTSKGLKKRKCRILSELLRELADQDVESTVHFDDQVDENTDKSDEDFTIDDEDDSDDDTLVMFLKKRKAVKSTSRRKGSRNYNNKKTRAPKPSNRGPKGSKARIKRPKSHPRANFANRKRTDALEAEVALATKHKRCDSRRGGTRQSVEAQPVVEVEGSKDPGPGRGAVTGPPSQRWTPLVCIFNENPADFTPIGRGNKYMRRF